MTDVSNPPVTTPPVTTPPVATLAPHKVCVVTYYTPESALYSRMGKAAERNRQIYCKRHGYALRVVRRSPGESKAEKYWAKLTILRELMDSGEFEWLFWTDVDALVTDHGRTVGGVIADASRNHGQHTTTPPRLIVTRDRLGLNSGNFLLKCCKWSQRYLDRVMASDKDEAVAASSFPEQVAMERVILSSRRWSDAVAFVPQRTFNSFPVGVLGQRWSPGDFVIHFAGIPRDKAAACMERYAVDASALGTKYACLDAVWYISFLVAGCVAASGAGPSGGLVAAVAWIVLAQAVYFAACAYI